MEAAKLAKISADAHVDEPHDLWYERMDHGLRDRAPRRIRAEQDGGWSLVVDDNPVGWMNLTAEEAQAKEDERTAAVSPEVRLEMLRTDSVNAEIIYPTIGLYVAQSFENYQLREVWTYLYALIALVALMEAWSRAVRRRLT